MASSFEAIQSDPSARRIFIVGGGIVGSALAYYLSQSLPGGQVVVLDKSLASLLGSTGIAPGFVGQLNSSKVLTRVAKASVEEYTPIPGAFSKVGGLEVASTSEGVQTLRQRLRYAQEAGLPAEIVSAEEAARLAPDFIKAGEVNEALYFPTAGTADPGVITRHFKERAEDNGVLFVEAAMTGLETETDGGVITGISTSKGVLQTASSTVILATGIWTRRILSSSSSASPITRSLIPIVPVAQPYTYTLRRPPRPGKPYPFVRWPEHHVYARDHGDCDGLGSYNHPPSMVLPADTAVGQWPVSESVLSDAAQTCLKNGADFQTQNDASSKSHDATRRPFNGIFSVTPDNLPFAGKAKATQNLWLCAAVWITHAAGTARFLAREILRARYGVELVDARDDHEHEELLKAFDPDRFRGGDLEDLTQMALARYNDIYNSEPVR